MTDDTPTVPDTVTVDAAAWRFVGAALTAVDATEWDDATRLDLLTRAADRLRADVAWLRAEGGQA